MGISACGDAPGTAADVGAQGWKVADRRRQRPARQNAGNFWLRQDRQRRRWLRQGFRNEGISVGARGARSSGREATVMRRRAARRRSFRNADVLSLQMRLVEATRGIVTRERSCPDEADSFAGQYQSRSV